MMQSEIEQALIECATWHAGTQNREASRQKFVDRLRFCQYSADAVQQAWCWFREGWDYGHKNADAEKEHVKATLAALYDVYLEEHGCFPLDRVTEKQRRANDVMHAAAAILGRG